MHYKALHRDAAIRGEVARYGREVWLEVGRVSDVSTYPKMMRTALMGLGFAMWCSFQCGGTTPGLFAARGVAAAVVDDVRGG